MVQVQGRSYHDVDRVNSTSSNGGRDRFHHRPLPKVDVEVGRRWKFQPIEQTGHLREEGELDLKSCLAVVWCL